jgi:hypothetical protein
VKLDCVVFTEAIEISHLPRASNYNLIAVDGGIGLEACQFGVLVTHPNREKALLVPWAMIKNADAGREPVAESEPEEKRGPGRPKKVA